MKDAMKGLLKAILLYIIGLVVYYLLTVLVLFILTRVFGDSFENIWRSAVPVMLLAHLLLLYSYISHLWKKRKKAKQAEAEGEV